MNVMTKEIRETLTPDSALEMLLDGNQRFLNQNMNQNYIEYRKKLK